MRPWSTLLLFVILLALGAYVYFIDIPAQRLEDKRETDRQKLLPFEDSHITDITMKTDTETVGLKHGTGQDWHIVRPIEAEADKRQVHTLIRALATGHVMRVVEESGAGLASFGLDHPSLELSLTAGSQTETLAIGDTGPLSSTLYVWRASDKKVLLTDLAPKDFLNRSLMAFRRKEVLQFTPADVERLRLTYPQTEIVLYSVEQKPKKKWKIRYPVEAEADQSEVQTLLFRLESLKALAIIDPGPAHDALAKTLTNPKVKATLQAGSTELTVKMYQPDPASGEAYAQSSSDAAIYKINPTSIKELTKELFALQDKRLLGADVPDIALLSVKARQGQYVLIREHDKWVLEDKPSEELAQDEADLFVSRIANLPAEERVLKQPAALAPYGLTAPAAEFVATSRDGKTIGKLTLGNQVGGLVYAMGQRLPGVYQARADILTQIPTSDALLKAASKAETGHKP